MKIDKIDKHILEILQQKGRITNAELAKQIGLSPAPTLERRKILERSGVITGYSAKLEPTKIGIGIQTFVEVILSRHEHDVIVKFKEDTNKITEIIGCYYVTGRADFLLRVSVSDMKSYENFLLHKLTTIANIQHVETMIILSNFKEQNCLPICLEKNNSKGKNNGV